MKEPTVRSSVQGSAEGSLARMPMHSVHRSHVLDLYRCDRDFPAYQPQPLMEYMLATLPRSGSTYLALELWRTGMLGAPMEYPNAMFARTMYARLGVGTNDVETFWDRIKHVRTSPNGVFGYKMFPQNYEAWALRCPRMLPRIAPSKVVFLTRASVTDQAISYSRALRSGAWFHDVPERNHPEYDAAHIAQCVLYVEYQLDFWHALFELTGSQVHRVTYEDLLVDHAKTLAGITGFLGVTAAPKYAIELPRLNIQRDAESEAWLRRFEQETRANELELTGEA